MTVADLRFPGTWRRYQELAFAAFEADRAAGRRRTHLVAPPGSGKTVIGLELVRRRGGPALVLVPNQAIQAQWVAQIGRCGGAGLVRTELDRDAPISVLTYQALCRLEDPGAALRELAQARWTAERAAATGESEQAVAAAAADWTGEAERRRSAQVSRIVAAIKREVARGEHPDLALADLLDRGARERVAALRAAGTATVVLDECHHLASLWGYVVRAVLAQLDAELVVGLTATPPAELTAAEGELYEALLGPVDFSVPTPAVVRDGFLAPYQELAWFCAPLASERAWLAEHDVRFAELVTALHDEVPAPDGVPAPLSFPAWVLRRMRERGAADGAAEVPWGTFQRRRPALARAGVRFLLSAGLAPPPGAPRGEAFREPPDLDDWLVLLEDYALGALAADPSPAAAARHEAIGAALRDLGFTLTRQGIRRGRSEVDRLLTSSAAKPLALVEVLACEDEARGEALRACVLCDAERAERRADGALTGVLDATAGTAARAVVALAEDLRTAPLRPLLVSGRALRCVPEDHEALAAALDIAPAGVPEPDADGLVELRLAAGPWTPRDWVPRATAALTAGHTRTLVGTRALLGEGWDAPCVNVLVDLTVATTGVSVRQMRGRSLRLDPQRPEKIASNWDVVCVAADLARGAADYRRFVRKHAHLLAPAEDGVIEAGPSHVHPLLGPFTPPAAAELAVVDRAMRARAADHAGARERWAIGTPYEAVERPTITVRPVREDLAAGETARDAGVQAALPLSQRAPVLTAAGGALAAAAGTALAGPVGLAGLLAVPGAGLWAGLRLRRAAALAPPLPPLDGAAHAVVEAYAALGELPRDVADSLVVEPRSDGYLRCRLRRGTPEHAALLATALEQLLGVVESPRYLVSRPIRVPGRGPLGMLARVLRRRPPLDERWHAVPDDLARRADRAEAFHRAWSGVVGPSQLRFVQRSDAGRALAVEAAGVAAGYEVTVRQVWS
ncbi:DEAD/DEAH box helicase family protein [Conexibacter sp. W3-3-2]|uniref:DEAD/DEAH box helicase family protein n=1 Tax=Conexibacter sp. W3-3-2 TaxID=2675227 RepID=UPI002815B14A|nr:DEAD/DEAH box helicase family protein [Conexibacter sp. W3-3-2]